MCDRVRKRLGRKLTTIITQQNKLRAVICTVLNTPATHVELLCIEKGESDVLTIGVLPADQMLVVLQDSPQLRVIVHHPFQGLCTHRGAC